MAKVKPLLDKGIIDNILVISTKSQVEMSVKHKQDWFSDFKLVFDREPKITQFKCKKNIFDHDQYDLLMVTHHYGELKNIIDFNVDLSRTVVVYDECHKLKNPGNAKFTQKGLVVKNGKAGYYAAQIAKRAFRILGLTATPSSGKWEDYANYLVMSGIVDDYEDFKQQYCQIGTKEVAYGVPVRNQIIGYKNLDKLRVMIEKIGYRTKQTEDFSGIEITEHTIPFIADKQALKEFTKTLEYTTYDGEVKIAENNASVIHCSKMLASGMNQEFSAKSKYVYDLLVEEKIGRTILFYNNIEEYDNLVRTIKRHNELLKKDVTYKTINGSLKELDFKTDLVDILLVQYQAGGEALNIQEYTNVIMFSPTYRYYSHKQALGRNNRVNQTEDITRYYLVNEIEEPIVEKLHQKKDYDYTDKDTYDKFWKLINA